MVVGVNVRNVYLRNRPSPSRFVPKKVFWVLLCEMASCGVFFAPCVMRGVWGDPSPILRGVVGPLRHEGGLGGIHSRGVIDLPPRFLPIIK